MPSARAATPASAPIGSGKGRADSPLPPSASRGARARLLMLIGLLVVAYAVFWVWQPLSEQAVRSSVEPLGVVAPLAFVAVAVVLGMMLVPGPVLAGAAGLLFGTAVGTAVTLSAAVATAVLALLTARRVGRPGVDALESRRVQAVSAALERHGLWAVIAQRLAPGIPDAPCSYAAGLLGVRVWHIALGTALGAAPRAFGYTAVGDSLDEPGSLLSLVGFAVLGLTAVVGAIVAGRTFVSVRREHQRDRD